MTPPAGSGVLVIGYGNVLRSDDGLGWRVAQLLATDERLTGARVLACHQLTPELAEDISASRLVVIVDARLDGGPPGSVRVETLERDHAAHTRGSHYVDASAVVDLAEWLYGTPPPVELVSVRVESLDAGEHLSPPVAAAIPEAVEAVLRAVEEAREGA